MKLAKGVETKFLPKPDPRNIDQFFEIKQEKKSSDPDSKRQVTSPQSTLSPKGVDQAVPEIHQQVPGLRMPPPARRGRPRKSSTSKPKNPEQEVTVKQEKMEPYQGIEAVEDTTSHSSSSEPSLAKPPHHNIDHLDEFNQKFYASIVEGKSDVAFQLFQEQAQKIVAEQTRIAAEQAAKQQIQQILSSLGAEPAAIQTVLSCLGDVQDLVGIADNPQDLIRIADTLGSFLDPGYPPSKVMLHTMGALNEVYRGQPVAQSNNTSNQCPLDQQVLFPKVGKKLSTLAGSASTEHQSSSTVEETSLSTKQQSKPKKAKLSQQEQAHKKRKMK